MLQLISEYSIMKTRARYIIKQLVYYIFLIIVGIRVYILNRVNIVGRSILKNVIFLLYPHYFVNMYI